MKSPTVLPRSARFLLLAAVLATAAQAAELTIVRVYPEWRDAASFKRISEYFNGHENTGGEQIVRTHPNQRAGYYFLVRVRNSGGPQQVKAHLTVINSLNAEPHAFDFPVELKARDTVFHLGLTGNDWNDSRLNPVAWKLDLLGADGQPLVTEKSYLWEKPAAK